MSTFTVDKVLKDGTNKVTGRLSDGSSIEIEVRPSTKAEMEINEIPPYIAIAADGVIEPISVAGETVDDAVLDLLERLNQRYAA